MKTGFTAALLAASATAVPTAVFHGLGDACIYPGMRSFTKELGTGTGDFAKCVEVGNGSLTSFFKNFETQAELGCKNLLAVDEFKNADEINVVGLSQGALIARYIVESCEGVKARNLLSIGGPNMGVTDIPHCFHGPLCKVVNKVARSLVYMGLVQDHLGPAGYFRDPKDYSKYLSDSVFLAKLNNESNAAAANKTNFESLNGLMLVMFTEDTMVYPKESEWFQTLDDKDRKVVALEDSDFYKNDDIGLKTLNDAKKVQFISVEGDHLQFSKDDVTNTFIPFLLS